MRARSRQVVREPPIRVEDDHARRYPGADKLATEVVINLVRTESLVAAEVNGRFRRFGLTGSTFNVLMLLNELTDTGRTVLRRTWRTHFPAQTEMMAVLSDSEKETLVRLLGKLQSHLEARARDSAKRA